MAGCLEKRTIEVLNSMGSRKSYLYFAHPVNTFNTQEERDLVKTLENIFPDFEIYNPNKKYNKENYRLWKEETGRGMNYYYEAILPQMDAGAYLAFKDGMIGAGVFNEAEFLLSNNKIVWEIGWNHDLEKINSLDYSRRLSIEETRAKYR